MFEPFDMLVFVSGIQLDQKITRQPSFFLEALFFDGRGHSGGHVVESEGKMEYLKKKPFDGVFLRWSFKFRNAGPIFFMIF